MCKPPFSNGLGVDPSNVQDQYNNLLVVKRDTGQHDHSWWDILSDLSGFTVEILISGILWLVGQFASLLMFWAYIIQKFILFSGYALSPLLIGFMAIRPLRSIGSRYLHEHRRRACSGRSAGPSPRSSPRAFSIS